MNALFRTPVDVVPAPFRADYAHPFFLMGSCFSEYTASRLQSMKFRVCCNPFGVVFNPASIARSLLRLCSGKPFCEADLDSNDGLFFSYDVHGSFSDPDREHALEGMNRALSGGHQALKEAKYLMITLGTAWVYVHQQRNEVVANCHKMPPQTFFRHRLDPAGVVALLSDALAAVWKMNPALRVVFSVSPVRHLKDGCQGNQVSKAALLLAVEQLCAENPLVSYFPAYEIMMDELRDYRFYDEDMVHPSATAVRFIWNRFVEQYISSQAQEIMKEVDQIVRAMEHRPLHPQSASFRTFMAGYARRTGQLQKQYPFLDLSQEYTYFNESLATD